MKQALQITIGLSLVLAVCNFSGCASWPTEGPSGTFTVTGIPAEYEGKFVKSSLYIPPEKGAFLSSPKEVARGPATAVMNGELQLPLYGKKAGYSASDTANVTLTIRDTAEALGTVYGNNNFDFVFADVQFDNGVAAVQWDNQITPGFVTVTNIPAEFANSTGATVYIGHPDYELKVTVVMKVPAAQGAEASCVVSAPTSVTLEGGIATGKFFSSEYGKYRHFPQSGTRDVILQLGAYADPDDPRTAYYSFFESKAAVIQDGRITLDFSMAAKN